jgi:putative membrane protein
MKKKLAESAALIAKGVCMGTADIIPGVSGGTMAYILGIYQRLLLAIATFNRHWFRRIVRLELRDAFSAIPFSFLLPLAAGIIGAVFIFTQIIPLPYYITHYPEPLYGLFFGLIAGSALLLLKQHARLRWQDGMLIVAGAAFGYLCVTLVPTNTPDGAWFLFLSGAIAISAMLLPGISGSFILLILGKYAPVLGALGNLDFAVLLPFMAGCIAGLLAFAHALLWLLRHYWRPVNLVITGILVGTLRAVWPFQERIYETVRGKDRLMATIAHMPPTESFFSLVGALMLAGFALVFVLERLARPNAS